MSFEELLHTVKKEREQEELERQQKLDEHQKANDPTRMIFTFHDIQQRQKLIDRLIQELESRAVAIKKIGADLYASREKNAELEAQVKSLQQKVDENNVKNAQLINTIDIDLLPSEEVKRRYALIAEKFRLEISKTRDLTEQLNSAQKIKIESNELEKKFLELRQAHKAQSVYIQTLQENLKNTSKYKDAIKKQEKVIQKLEVLLKDSMGGSNKAKLEEFFTNAKIDPDSFDGGVYRLLTEENQMLKDKLLKLERATSPHQRSHDFVTEYEVQRLKDELAKEKDRYQELMDDRDTELFKLMMRAEKAESRVQALESELQKSAKTYAKQIVELKLRESTTPFLKRSNPSSRRSTPTSDSRKPSYFLDPL